MVVNINQTCLHDVKNIGVSNCELSIMFYKEHRYSSIEEIEKLLNEAGLSIGNFHFKGVSKWAYPYDGIPTIYNGKEAIFDIVGETSILCIIPENIRNTFQVHCFEAE